MLKFIVFKTFLIDSQRYNLEWTNFVIPDEKKAVTIAHFEKIYEDIRDELKLRMKQRDTYSIEMITVVFGLSGAFFIFVKQQSSDLPVIILAIIPSICIYFTCLILYSYRVSITLSVYLGKVIEPKLVDYYGIPPKAELMSFKNDINSTLSYGIRRIFFLIFMWVVYFSLPAYLVFVVGLEYMTVGLQNQLLLLLSLFYFVTAFHISRGPIGIFLVYCYNLALQIADWLKGIINPADEQPRGNNLS